MPKQIKSNQNQNSNLIFIFLFFFLIENFEVEALLQNFGRVFNCLNKQLVLPQGKLFLT